MNTLSYFLSTLRPAPPPSPRASTSELPIPLDHPRSPSTPLDTTSPTTAGEALESSADVLDTDGESSERGIPSARDLTQDTIEAVYVSDGRGEPPRIGIVPPSRSGSRKGKSRAPSEPGEETEPSQQVVVAPESTTVTTTFAWHGKEGTSTLSSDDRPSWPFVVRLARTWPFRFTASIYLLIRRFLSLFGLSYPPRPHSNALLASLSTEPVLDPEKSAQTSHRHFKNTIISLAITRRAQTSTPPSSGPPSPSLTPSLAAPTIPRAIRAPPRMTPKTLVLDLDETLIHSTSRPTSIGGRRSVPKGLKTTMVEVVLDGRSTMYTVYKRPWVDFFLRKVSSWYTVIIFTASLPEYADPVIDWLDGGDGRGGLIGGRLFRAHCLAKNGTYMKDLTVVDPDLAKVCLVDNSPVSYAINQANGIPIEGWINDPNDECLLDLLPMLDSLRFTNDVRRVLGLRGFGRTAGHPSMSSSSSSSSKLPLAGSTSRRNSGLTMSTTSTPPPSPPSSRSAFTSTASRMPDPIRGPDSKRSVDSDR
ncbi:Nem1-Spo7 phosphatase catalytic subunit NEM1 [Sporobolomyces koalae]|uniref:Nem1-Spo7 phosphatase catalytic subunit NEM1 n=1 Tax=Sporobolomyces koalae TaxID=500713 RepID=UPI00316FAB97